MAGRELAPKHFTAPMLVTLMPVETTSALAALVTPLIQPALSAQDTRTVSMRHLVSSRSSPLVLVPI